MNEAYLLTGSNMGDRTANLTVANELISQRCGKVCKNSSIYETAAWGNRTQSSFLNQALYVNTPLNAFDLLSTLLSIEKELGRVRNERYGPRIIDIDIIFFNHEVINGPKLKIPHPEMQKRMFVLLPLSEIAAAYIHPLLKVSVSELLQKCDDRLAVKKFLPA